MSISAILMGAVTKRLIDGALGIFDRYQKKEITRVQVEAELKQVVMTSWAEVEKAWAAATSAMYGSLMQAATKSKLVAVGWIVTLFSQLAVLLWHQIGIPAYTHFTGNTYPSSGTTVEWAYLLIALLLGGGGLMLKGRPPKL